MSYEIAQRAAVLHLVDGAGELEAPGTIINFLRAQIARDQAQRLEDVGLQYRVIGVFGGQSSGKSTLLNSIFGTKFQTMDESKGRQQTTTGAYLSQSPNGKNTFVIDFEGTDGMERGEDQTFERQLSLFALSIADTLVINMWANEVGRFNAANLQLLRTVFEVNLQLTANIDETLSAHADPQSPSTQRDKEKPTLLFVLRDTASTTPDSLFDSLRKSLAKVWEGVTKPPKYADARMEDLFILRFQAMSHYVYRRDDFNAEIKRLQASFMDPADKDYFYSTEETFRGVPLEGLPQYLASCWSAIKSSKDLNIPSQREMLAVVRCNELTEQYLTLFTTHTAELRTKIKNGERLPRLSLLLEQKIHELEEQFSNAARLYTARIVLNHRRKLRVSLDGVATQLIRFQCSLIVADELGKIEGSIQRIVDDALATLSVPIKESGAGGITASITRRAHGAASLVGAALADYNAKKVDQFWLNVRNGVDATVEALQSALGGEKATGESAVVLASDPRSLDLALELLRESVKKKLLSRFEAMASDATTPMNKVFESTLNIDPNTKMQRSFLTKAAYEAAYTPAFHAGSLVLNCLFAAHLDAPTEADKGLQLGVADSADMTGKPMYPASQADVVIKAQRLRAEEAKSEGSPKDGEDQATVSKSKSQHVDPTVEEKPAPNGGEAAHPTAIILLTESAVERAFELYQQQCQFAFKLQVHQIESSKGNIPAWVYLALVLLGWNEAWYVVTSPLLLLVIVLVIVMFFKDWVSQQWGAFEASGPPHIVLPLQALFAAVRAHAPVGLFGAPGAAATPQDKSEKEKKDDRAGDKKRD